MAAGKKTAAPKAVEWDEGDVHLRTIDGDGGVSLTYHRCWNVREFLRNRFRDTETAKTAPGVTEKQRDRMKVEVLTAAQFEAARKRKARHREP